MSELALKLIAENKAKHARGEDARVLDLGNRGLTEIPEEVGELIWLEEVYIEFNFAINLNKSLLKLKCMKHLRIEGGRLFTNGQIYHEEIISQLNNLTSLELVGIKTNDLSFLQKLTNLKRLMVIGDGYTDISPISMLINLEYLYLGKPDLITRSYGEPYNFGDSLEIENIDCLKKLEYIKSLHLENMNLMDISVVSSMKNLENISLGKNNVYNFSCLQKTQIKLLSARLNVPEAVNTFGVLNTLKVLELPFSKIDDINFLKYIKNLEAIDLSGNPIKNIETIRELKFLTKINLNSTKVHDIYPLREKIQQEIKVYHYDPDISGETDFIEEAYSKPYIFLGECPLVHPPLEIVEQGNAAILRYFEDLEKSGSDQIYEAKLLLIGEGGAGKTSLCRKLFDPNAELPQEKDRTKGIDIHPLYFDIPGKTGKQFRLNIWDFAGQGKYQSAHSFFYTHRSLYVLVDDTRTLNENDAYRTLYNNWLQTTELFGGQSPVLVLHNEKDGCTRTGFSLGGFQEHFGFVHGELFRINLGGGDTAKIEDLRRQIERQALALPHIGDTVPKTWVKVREALETERQDHPYIPAERYRALCEAEGITDPERQSDLSHYFHDLGIFLHFQDNPLLKRDVFLQNQWVTDAVYKILDDAQIAGAQRGRFTPADLQRLWHESTYRERRDELLALMLQFELCYQVQDTATHICPQLLPGDIPQYDLGTDIPLQLKYEYVFIPKGLLYRLIVRLHRHIAQGQTAVWNAGVVLERAGAKAEITESLDRRTISVRATGLLAKELVTIINEEVERLHAPFGERLKVTVRIPCNCHICIGSHKPHFYDKIDLDTRLRNGKATVECSVSYDDVPVRGLLDGVFVKNLPSDRLNSNQKGPVNALNLFISYSKSDKEYLESAKKHLNLFVRQGKLRVWDDTQLIPGKEWDEAIKRELAAADIILFLVSADLLATDYIWNVEMETALARAEAGEVIVVPVIIRDCTWTDAPFGKFNALPTKGTPIATAPNADAAWKEVVERIGKIC